MTISLPHEPSKPTCRSVRTKHVGSRIEPEADLMSLGDGVGVNPGCVLQTHLVHDRIMIMEEVTLEDGATADWPALRAAPVPSAVSPAPPAPARETLTR